MKPVTISMRELQQNLKKVIQRVERGETLELTRRRRVVARLVPAAEARPVPPWPDLEARARANFGDRNFSDPSPSEMPSGPRGTVVTTYFDSSVIVASYVQEPRSRKARKALSAVVSAPFTPFLDLEVRTALWRMAAAAG